MKHLPILLLIAIGSCSIATASDETDLQAATSSFYRWYFSRENISLPSDSDTKRLRPIASLQLLKLLARARVTEKGHIARTPRGDKPLLIEGDIFSGLYEGATSHKFGSAKVTGKRAVITVHLEYQPRKVVEAEWTDDLVFIRADGRWLLDDVLRSKRGGLVAMLADYSK